jgi:copper chaperone
MTDTMNIAETREYIVAGMTCSHCVLSVREEISELPAVQGVEVDLASGRLTVMGAAVEDDAVRAAVADAGYEVV